MKKEKPIIIKFNFSKYYFEDKELIYYTNKGIYKYEELFPKSKGYENPLKIKKLELISIIASALQSKGKIVMEKVLLNAKQAAEVSLNKGYEWFKNQVFKQIREAAERGESELHWGISYPY